VKTEECADPTLMPKEVQITSDVRLKVTYDKQHHYHASVRSAHPGPQQTTGSGWCWWQLTDHF